jgi:hypothetical protein
VGGPRRDPPAVSSTAFRWRARRSTAPRTAVGRRLARRRLGRREASRVLVVTGRRRRGARRRRRRRPRPVSWPGLRRAPSGASECCSASRRHPRPGSPVLGRCGAEATAPPGSGTWAVLLDDRAPGSSSRRWRWRNWHAVHPCCARCGAPHEIIARGHQRRCPEDASEHYPRTDPAVIMAVVDGADRMLLGRQASWPEKAVLHPGRVRRARASRSRTPCAARSSRRSASAWGRGLPGQPAVAVPVEPDARLPRRGTTTEVAFGDAEIVEARGTTATRWRGDRGGHVACRRARRSPAGSSSTGTASGSATTAPGAAETVVKKEAVRPRGAA